jgi:ABC-type dipeptide/oligopeptide/nickel transport system permease component
VTAPPAEVEQAPVGPGGAATPHPARRRAATAVAARLGWLLLVVWVAVTVTFVLSRIVPADPARLAAGLQAGPEQVAEVRHVLGLDRPLPEQYARYIVGLAELDFGRSIQSRQPVAEDLKLYLPATLELVLASFAVYVVVGIAAGVVWAVWPRGVHAVAIRLLSIVGVAVPVFWVGLLLQLAFAARLNWLPVAGNLEYQSYGVPLRTGIGTVDALLAGNLAAFGNALEHLALPVATLVLGQLALAARLTRASLAHQLEQPYVRTARARGVAEWRVVLVDALRNALNPVVTMLGLQFGWLLGGTILVEVTFSWPGLGMYAFNSFRTFDYDPIMAITLITTIAFVLANELVGLIYPLLDPRMRETS